ncbi:MAG: hypothetical protein M3O70_02645 [Actinomycetota bacterium]|nr:hypothetical protein [Actinomycetota bacterium]
MVLMFQGVTPRQELVLPGVETTGFETSTTPRRAHFMAGAEDRSPGDGPVHAQKAPGDEGPPTPPDIRGT